MCAGEVIPSIYNYHSSNDYYLEGGGLPLPHAMFCSLSGYHRLAHQLCSPSRGKVTTSVIMYAGEVIPSI